MVTEDKEGEKKAPEKEQYIDIEKSPIYPMGIGVSGHPGGILISFYFIPPEDQKRIYVLSRVELDLDTSERLSNSLKKAIEESRTRQSKETKT